MAILENIAAIAKGMSITYMEMFPPTVENYPDGLRESLRGAQLQERFRGVHVLQRQTRMDWKKCVACFLCAASCPSNCAFLYRGGGEYG